MSYRPPDQSLALLEGIDFSRAIEILQIGRVGSIKPTQTAETLVNAKASSGFQTAAAKLASALIPWLEQ